MAVLKQIVAISLMNLRNIPQRLGPSLVIVVGIGGVVMVLVALLSMAQGFRSTLEGTGSDARALILRSGSTSEINGAISYEQANIIENLPAIAKGKSGPLVARETYVSVNIKKRGNNSGAYVPFRGVSENSFTVRPEFKLLSGRNIERGEFEVIVGINAANQFLGLDVGRQVSLRGTNWDVVGTFSAEGSINESEIWGDVLIVNSQFNRGNSYSSMLAQMAANSVPKQLQAEMDNDRRLVHAAHRETDFYAAQANNTTAIIEGVGIAVSSIMAIGAIFAILNTMYSSVSGRVVEIATLRALGFGNTPVVFSVMLESLILALAGGILGGVLTFLIFNGFTASTFGASTQVSFDFQVTSELVVSGITLACVLGLIGGLLPAISAARVPITVALRAS